MSDEEAVLVSYPRDDVAVVTLNRPEKLNPMNQALVDGIYAACDEIDARPRLRVAILTGAGRGFCAGADLGGFGDVPGTEDMGRAWQFMAIQQKITGLVPRLQRLKVPVIAAVNGPAAGGGFALVLASDVRIAATSARFNVAFIRIGLSACDIGTSWLLPRIVGAARAHELMLTGRIFDAPEAERIGLVAQVVARRGAARRRALEGGRDLCQQPVGGVPDQGSDVGRAGDPGLASGAGPREPHASARGHDVRRSRSDDGVPREARAGLEVRLTP
jgi:enoyl-CoA hydratase/carnithine racemase